MLTPCRPIALLLGVLFCLPPTTDEHREEPEEDDTEILEPDIETYRPTSTPDLRMAAERVVALTNELRAEKRLPTLAVDPLLRKTGDYFADYMARTSRYGHHADGRGPADRAKKFEYDYCLIDENIAYAFRTRGFGTEELAKEIFEGWKGSPGHLKNMLDPDVIETDVTIREGKGGYFFAVQLFGRPKSKAIGFKLTNDADTTFEYELGGEPFELRPRVTRTHEACRPRDLEFVWHPAEQESRTVAPGSGDHFVITKAGDRLQVQRQ